MKSSDCSGCIFFQREGPLIGVDGTCRRYPPQVSISLKGQVASLFPPVKPTSYCGEYMSQKAAALRVVEP